MKLLLLSASILFQFNSYAGDANLCEIEDFRDSYQSYCTTTPVYEVDEDTGQVDKSSVNYYDYSFHPGAKQEIASLKKINPNLFKEEKTNFVGMCTSDCEQALISKFRDTLGRQDDALNIKSSAYSSYADLVQREQDLEVLVDEAANKKAKTEQFADEFSNEKKIYNTVKKDGDPSYKEYSQNCLKNRVCNAEIAGRIDGQKASLKQSAEKSLQDTSDRLDATSAAASKLLKDIDKAYGNGQFKKFARKQLEKADPSLKGSKQSMNEICGDRKQSRKVLLACDGLNNKAEAVAKIVKNVEGIKKEIADSNDLDFLQVKLNLMDMSDEQRKLALKGIDEETKKKMEGTVLGRMMDQVREDMCSVANNPQAMCTGAAYNVNKFVDDSSEIAKEAVETFQKRNVSSSSATKE